MSVFTCGSVRWGCESGGQSEHREDGYVCGEGDLVAAVTLSSFVL